jgi:PAS domain S-box-containing protein
VLEKLSQQVRDCHERAADAKQKAEATDDPALKADLLDLERRWLALSRSYAFTESLGDFTAASWEWRRKSDERARAALPEDALRLQEISTLLIEADDLDSLYGHILDATIGLMSADMGSMQTLYPERNELRLLAWRGFHPESAAFWEWVRLDSASTCGAALSAGHRVTVPDVEACSFMAGTADLDAYRRSGIRAVQSTPLVSRSGRLLGMISTHWREPHQPAERALRLLDVLARQAADLIERSQVEAALRESDERSRQLASIVESSDDSIISEDLDGIITTWNKGAEGLFGYTAEEVIGKPVTILMPHQDEELAILERIRRGERTEHYETVRRCKHGSLVDVSLSVSPIKNAQGKIIGAAKIARDITERKRSEAQIAILAREAEHRAKNVLASVLATVHLSQSDTPDGLKAAIEGRIQALANVHALFVQSRWTGANLRNLVMQELSPYSQDGETRARIDGPDLLLEPDTAQTIAVTLHELTTNAAKYGALSAAQGHVRVEWSRAADGRLALRWTESGGPSVNTPTHQGFGTRVMESMIRGQLRGEICFDWRAEGLACEIVLQTCRRHGHTDER